MIEPERLRTGLQIATGAKSATTCACQDDRPEVRCLACALDTGRQFVEDVVIEGVAHIVTVDREPPDIAPVLDEDRVADRFRCRHDREFSGVCGHEVGT